MRDFPDAPVYQKAQDEDRIATSEPILSASVPVIPEGAEPAKGAEREQQKRLQRQRRTMIHLTTHPAVAEGDLHRALGSLWRRRPPPFRYPG
jgi:hypothetical protein